FQSVLRSLKKHKANTKAGSSWPLDHSFVGRGRGSCITRPKIFWSKSHVAPGSHALLNEVQTFSRNVLTTCDHLTNHQTRAFNAFPWPVVQNPRSGRWSRFAEIYGGHTTMLHDPKLVDCKENPFINISYDP
ncbi:unnamed protein product, partial [Prunus brigantina]